MAELERRAAPPEVPAEFWAHPSLVEAFAARHIGLVLRAYRRHPWHGPDPVPQTVVADWLHTTQAHLSRLESRKSSGTPEWLRVAACTLHIPLDRLWSAVPGPADVPVPAVPARLLPAALSATSRVAWEDVVAARQELGYLLGVWRRRVGLTQQQLAVRVEGARGTVASAESGRIASLPFWAACDKVIGAEGVLLAAAGQARAIARRYQDQEQSGVARRRVATAGRAATAVRAAADGAGSAVGVGQVRDDWPAVQVVVPEGGMVTFAPGEPDAAGGRPLRIVVSAAPAVSQVEATAEVASGGGARVYQLAARRGRR